MGGGVGAKPGTLGALSSKDTSQSLVAGLRGVRAIGYTVNLTSWLLGGIICDGRILIVSVTPALTIAPVNLSPAIIFRSP